MERRKRSWPVKYLITKPTLQNPRGSSQMFYAHEWEAFQKSIEAGQSHEEAIRTALGPFAPPQPASESPSDPPDPATAPPGPDPATPPEPTTPYISSSSPRHPIPPDFSRHSRYCMVCAHPDRDAIEGDFIRWRSPELIARDYKIANRSSIYRHAHSTGLFAWRKRELGRTLESILECSEQIPLGSADVIIRAARIYAHLDDHGYWFEPPRTNYHYHGPAPSDFPLESVLPANTARVRKRPDEGPLELEPEPMASEAIPTAQEAPASEASPTAQEAMASEANPTAQEALAAEASPTAQEASSNIPSGRISVNSMNPEEKTNS